MLEMNIGDRSKMMGFTELKSWLRHKHPMIFLDRITDYKLNESISALVAVSGNTDCIDGHFPERAIFPATHLQQSFCQAAVILLQLSTAKLQSNQMVTVGAMNSRFYKMATPGDLIEIEVVIDRLYSDSLMFSGLAKVNDEKLATIKTTMMRLTLNEGEKQLW